MSRLPPARWWSVRRAHNRMPKTYKCPICGHPLPSLSEHMLLTPEGDASRRRHAHTACVLAARRRGELVLEEEWRRAQRRSPGSGSRWAAIRRRVLSFRRDGSAKAPPG